MQLEHFSLQTNDSLETWRGLIELQDQAIWHLLDPTATCGEVYPHANVAHSGGSEEIGSSDETLWDIGPEVNEVDGGQKTVEADDYSKP